MGKGKHMGKESYFKFREEDLQRIISNLREIIAISDLEGRFTFISPSVREQLGYEVSEGLGRHFKDFIHPDDVKSYVEYFNRDIKEEMDKTTLNFRVRHKDGSYRWYNIRGRIVYDEGGKPLEYIGIGIDITEQINKEEELRRAYEEIETAYQQLQAAEEELKAQYEELHSTYEQLQAAEEEIRAQYETLEKNQQELLNMHKKMEDIVNSLPDATFVIDQEDNVIFWNYAMELLTGVPAKEAVGQKSYLFTGRFYETCRPSLAHYCLAGKLPEGEEYHNISSKNGVIQAEIGPVNIRGKMKYFWLTAAPLYNMKGEIGGAIENIRDITDNKLVENELRQSEEKFRSLAESTPVMIFVGQGEKYKYVNPAFCEVTGYSAEELYNDMLIWDVVHPDDREKVRQRGLARQRGEDIEPRYELKLLTKEGETKYILYSGSVFEYEGKPALMGTGIDITERYIAEKKLRRREEQLSIIAENTLDLISQVDEEGRLIYASPSHLFMLGYKPEKSVGVSVFNIIHPDDREKAWQEFKKTLATGEPNRFEYRLRKADGSYVWVETLGKALKGKDSRPVLITISRDISERKEMEERLRYIAEHDVLTGLYNRFYFEQMLDKFEKEKKVPAAIIVTDVDGLKLINDTLGHESGDRLLKTYASILQRCFPKGSIIARVGGDEFAVILPGSLPHLVDEYVKCVREEIDTINRNKDILLSVSMGKAVRLNAKITMQELFREADKLMYREKLLHSQSTKSSIVDLLMKALEARDYITEGHTDRLQEIVRKMGERIGLSESRINDLCLLARFHDIGKVGISDRILFKPGKLTEEEFEEMKKHSEIGFRIAQSSPDLAHIADFILKHHERWDGSGYPLRLKETEIPLECRILALADAYDAMSNDRPYRKAMNREDIIVELTRCSGKQFDPWLTSVFINLLSELEE